MHPQIQMILNQSVAEFQAGNLTIAENLLKRLLSLDSKNVPALSILGLVKASQGQHSEAAGYFKKAVTLFPNDGSLRYNLASALLASGKESLALEHFVVAVRLMPEHQDAILNYSKCLSRLGHFERAMIEVDKLLALSPLHVPGLLNKAALLKDLDRFEEAIVCADRILNIDPNSYIAWSNRGVACKALKNYSEAISSYEKSLSINPNHDDALNNLGVIFTELKKYPEAISCYEKALFVNPHHEDALNNLGVALTEIKDYSDALKVFSTLKLINGNYPFLSGNIFNTSSRLCLWADFDALKDQIRKSARVGNKVISPFYMLSLSSSAYEQLKVAQVWAQSRFRVNGINRASLRYKNKDKIKVGYFSPDFKAHAVSFLTAEIYELHDRENFEVYAFSYGDANSEDEMRQRLKNSFDHFIDVAHLSDLKVAKLAQEIGIDVAVDLCGFTEGGRHNIFSYGAAPIQINFLGYPGTLGSKSIDYIIGDRFLIPEVMQKNYTEKVIYLPHSFQSNDRKRRLADSPLNKIDFGIPEDVFIFCCFNNTYKITPEILEVWSNILKKVDRSILWLLEDSIDASNNLRDEFERMGIQRDRIHFSGRLPPADYLARYQIPNLFLDTSPFNGGTTVSDALWAGLPTLTISGEVFASRMAGSLLSAVNLKELITHSFEDYETLAIQLANNPSLLASFKERLREAKHSSPLFDSVSYVKHLEAGFIAAVEKQKDSSMPDHIYIE